VYGTSQKGALTATALGDSSFDTLTVPNSPNTTRLFLAGKQVDVKASGMVACPQTPTPTPIPTFTPTPEPTSTPVPDATPTPIEMFLINGMLKGVNGRNLSSSEKKTMKGMEITVLATDRSGNQYAATVASNFTWFMEVPDEYYNISLESDKKLTVTSRPRTYRMWVEGPQGGLHFAVRPRGIAVSGDSGTNTGANGGKAKPIKRIKQKGR